MDSEARKTTQSRIGGTQWCQMSGGVKEMMKMMEDCCPGMKERCTNENGIQTFMKSCCGAMKAQSEMPSGSPNKPEQKTDRKDLNKCCS